MTDPLLTPEEVGNLLRVSRSTVYRWVHYGFIPHVKLGAAVRFDLGQVKAWVRARSTKGRSRLVPVLDLSGSQGKHREEME